MKEKCGLKPTRMRKIMNRIIATVAWPAAGKTTWAKQFILDNPEWVRISRDDLRATIGGPDYVGMDKTIEKKVMKERNRLILEALDNGKDMIIDEMFINPKARKTLEQIVKGRATIEYKFFTDVSLEECIRRDATRTGRWRVGEKIIRMMYGNYMRWKADEDSNK
jgi:predicted kinase